MSKPREFWIEEWNNGNWHSSTCYQIELTAKIDLIHVIEKSAYDSAIKERDEALKALEFYASRDSYDLDRGTRQKNRIMEKDVEQNLVDAVKALEIIEGGRLFPVYARELRQIARDALKKIREQG